MDKKRYKVIGPAGSGGFGNITELHDTYLDRRVLYKQIRDPSHKSQLTNEVAGLVQSRSRHIVEIYDAEFDSNKQLDGIIIEKLDGRNFIEFYKEAQLDSELTTKVIYQIACALESLHAHRIVHRDLKLDNFKASSAGVIKLYDFGISSQSGHLTVQNKGSYFYAGPELYAPNAIISTRSDIYSFGICCWLLTTPNLPSCLLECPPLQHSVSPSIATVAPYLDSTVIALIDRCLLKDPKLRPSAKELESSLVAALVKGKHKGTFTSTRTNSKIYELSKSQTSVRITIGRLGELRAAYSGLAFYVTGFSGDVTVNNMTISTNMTLHDACVITFGPFSAGSDREFITFSCSKPEVVL
ncbi:protein kinase [Xanthomonas campestris pv. campestris]|uniref:protein kinase domain-containing protein n=1 Tax=Xanthomonas campestris TaxID=339 RepID=UPI002B3D2BF0|nr:protein kinase [Xanthomonas campestris pv. campestris]WVL67935.1 protein kinase [Xanthomonas campestris pv. campestris]